MVRVVEYFFSMNSPWAYLGNSSFHNLARQHNCKISYRPVSLPALFPETGGLPLAKRHPARQRYRLVELQRWREKRGVDLKIRPAHWPFDPGLADSVVIAAILGGHDVEALLAKAFPAIWSGERDLGSPDVLAEIATAAGLPGEALVAQAKGPDVAAEYAENHNAAIAADVFGSPSYVLNGEVFWGQDRLDLLADALASGRAPYSADV